MKFAPGFHWQLFQAESSHLLKLAFPILLAQIALTGLGVIDTIMSGWVGTNDLAAIGLGSNIMLPVFIFTTGILLAITPLVSNINGQPQTFDFKKQNISLCIINGLWLCVPLGAISFITLTNLDWLLALLELQPRVYQLTEDYLFYVAFGLPAIAFYQALRFFWEGLEKTLPTMWISFFALLANIPLNYIFIYGIGPIEPMGAAGCGVATAIVMWLMLFIAILYVSNSQQLSLYFAKENKRNLRNNEIRDILKIGVPNSFALLFEIGMFSFIALFIAVLGTTVIAAHQIAISFTSVAFMVPFSLAMAITVRVGKNFGANQKVQTRNVLYTGFIWAFFIGVLLAFVSYFYRFEIVSLYSFDPLVIQLATTLLIFASMYQIFDAIQVSAAGALRGFKDTKVTMLVTFFSYWVIALGLGYILTFTHNITDPQGVSGFWVGIVIGLFLAALLLTLRLRFVFNDAFKP